MFNFRVQLLSYFFLLSLFSFSVNAQVSISGKVINSDTHQPIAGASIYFNNTSIGTSSNEKGEFAFRNIDLVNTELIISSVGYEILALKLTAASDGKYFLCQLTVKEEQLKEVLVISDAQRRRWIDLFKKNFLGLTEEADRSTILNQKDIYFTSGTTASGFKAYADTPLIIVNKLLGFKVSFQLIEFDLEDNGNSTYFYGYTRYEELGDKKRWIINRKKAYYGSTLHFYRSLINDQLSNEGYDLYIVEEAKSGALKNQSVARSVTGTQVLSKLPEDSGFFRITVTGKLMVQYKKNPPSKSYLSKKTMLQGNLPTGFRAYIVSDEPYYLLDKTGILQNPLSVRYDGYWVYERAANLLPFNYQPE